jgi:hypothetical protein
MKQGGPKRDVNNYQPPRGPTNIMDPKSPGLNGTNHGCCGSQEAESLHSQSSGSPGIGSTGHCCQGKH